MIFSSQLFAQQSNQAAAKKVDAKANLKVEPQIKSEFPEDGYQMTLKEFNRNIVFRWSNSATYSKEKINYRLSFWGVPGSENVDKFVLANEPDRQQEVGDKTEWASLAAPCCYGGKAAQYPNPYDSSRIRIPKKGMIANPNTGLTVVWNVDIINKKGEVLSKSKISKILLSE